MIKFVSVSPPFFTSIMEDGLWIKNHSSTAGMAGNDDFRGELMLNFLNFLWCCGLTFLASLLASEISLVSLDKSRNKYSEVGGTVVLLQRAD